MKDVKLARTIIIDYDVWVAATELAKARGISFSKLVQAVLEGELAKK